MLCRDIDLQHMDCKNPNVYLQRQPRLFPAGVDEQHWCTRHAQGDGQCYFAKLWSYSRAIWSAKANRCICNVSQGLFPADVAEQHWCTSHAQGGGHCCFAKLLKYSRAIWTSKAQKLFWRRLDNREDFQLGVSFSQAGFHIHSRKFVSFNSTQPEGASELTRVAN